MPPHDHGLQPGYALRLMRDDDIAPIIDICKLVYPGEPPYTIEELADHRKVFPEGQFVVEHVESGVAVGVQATLVVLWSDYGDAASWDRFTDHGTFLNHDPVRGHTVYGADMMVHPRHQHHGLSRALIEATRALVRAKGYWRVRAGSRLPGYHLHPDLPPEAYVREVEAGRIDDPVLSVHLREGWSVFGVVPNYLPHDAESRGCAALIEWRNPDWNGGAPV
jgi:GNAT superfamily N-acetyltransferase